MATVSTRISELIWRTDNRSAIRGLKEIADQGASTTDSLKVDADEQSASFRRTAESAGALRDSMMGLAGMVGIGGVAFGLKDMLKGGEALQAQQTQLQTALRATGQTAGDTADKLKTYAESLSTKGGFGTTENLQALTQFVRETHNAQQAQSMLTLATNIARGRSMDLASAQTVVARAYTGNVGRLQQLLGPMVAVRNAQVGLTVAHQEALAPIEDQAALMGKLGGQYLRTQEIAMHLTAAQQEGAALTDKHATAQMVLANATKYFANATSSYNKQTAGQASDLTNALHNLTEELGTALLPAMDWVIARATSIARWMDQNKWAVYGLVGAFGALGAALGLSKLIKAVSGLKGDIGKLAVRFGIMGAAGEEAGTEAALGGDAATFSWDAFFTGTLIGIGIMALIEIGTHWKQFEGLVVGVWQSIEQWVSNAWHNIENAVTKSVNFIWGKIKWLGDEAKKLWADSPLGGLVGFGSNLLGGHVGRAFGDLAQGATLGAYQANTGTLGVPGRNLWESGNSSQPAAPTTLNNTTHVNIDGREVARAVTRAVLNQAARGPSNLVGGSLQTGSPGLPVGS